MDREKKRQPEAIMGAVFKKKIFQRVRLFHTMVDYGKRARMYSLN